MRSLKTGGKGGLRTTRRNKPPSSDAKLNAPAGARGGALFLGALAEPRVNTLAEACPAGPATRWSLPLEVVALVLLGLGVAGRWRPK